MYVNITVVKTIKMFIFTNLSGRQNGKPSSRIYKKLGKYNELYKSSPAMKKK